MLCLPFLTAKKNNDFFSNQYQYQNRCSDLMFIMVKWHKILTFLSLNHAFILCLLLCCPVWLWFVHTRHSGMKKKFVHNIVRCLSVCLLEKINKKINQLTDPSVGTQIANKNCIWIFIHAFFIYLFSNRKFSVKIQFRICECGFECGMSMSLNILF